MMTQSVGCAFDRETPLGNLAQPQRIVERERECETPLWSCSGATTMTSSESCAAIRSKDLKPRRMNAVVIGDQNAHLDPRSA